MPKKNTFVLQTLPPARLSTFDFRLLQIPQLGAKTSAFGFTTTAQFCFKSHNWELKHPSIELQLVNSQSLNPTIGS